MAQKKGCIAWNKGKKLSDKHKENLSKSNKGKKGLQKAWNKGKKGIMKLNKTSFIKGSIPWNKDKKTGIKPWLGKKRSPEDRKKMGLGKKGNHYPKMSECKRGKKASIKTRIKMSKAHKGKRLTEEHKRNIKKNHAKYWKGKKMSSEHIRKVLSHQGKSSLEIKFENIIKQLGLPYKFVGNGEVMIARKVPDFINSNGKKIAIEVFYRKHKEQFRNGFEVWKADRARIFQENGWKIIFFDETQVNSETLKNKLGNLKL